MVGALTGVVIGITTAVIALLWQRSPVLGLVVGLALLVNHTMATTTGAGIPFVMKKLGFDPATSSAPFVATLVDVTGLCIYFTVALLILRGTLL